MPFTTAELAEHMGNPNLAQWAASTLQNQGPFIDSFTAYFTGIQTWITEHGGADPFGWDDVTGLTLANGNQVVLHGPQQTAPFNDAFNDVRAHIANPDFRLFQAAEAAQRLIIILGNME